MSRGLETGRGLERVIEEIRLYFLKNNISFDFYEGGLIRNEWKAVFLGLSYLAKLKGAKNGCYFAVYPVSAVFPSFIRKKPLVTAVHDMVPYFVHGYDNGLKYAVKRFCIRHACLHSDHLIVSFSSAKEKIVELFKINPDKITVISYGVDHGAYYPDKTPKIKNRVAFLGEAKRAKGLDSVIRAFDGVLKKVPDATLVIASNGNELEQMKQLAKETLPAGSYEFAGFIPEEKMREFYNAAHVFVFPSRYGFGLSALEAMACGTPAIIGACLDSLDFIKDPDLLVNPDDTQDLARKISAFLTDRPMHAKKSQEAMEIAKKYSWDRMARQYHETLIKAAAKPTPRRCT